MQFEPKLSQNKSIGQGGREDNSSEYAVFGTKLSHQWE
jgi:hypothetical protein